MHHVGKIFLVLVLNHGAAAFDAWTTRQLVRYPGGGEANPLERPFVHSAALYFTSQPDAFLADYLLLKHARTKTRRVIYDSVGVGITGLHFGSALHNLALLDEAQAADSPRTAVSRTSRGETDLERLMPHVLSGTKGLR